MKLAHAGHDFAIHDSGRDLPPPHGPVTPEAPLPMALFALATVLLLGVIAAVVVAAT